MTTESAIDLVAIGEVLVDFISTEVADSLSEAATFQRHLGGSPANIATNVSRLGRQARGRLQGRSDGGTMVAARG